MQEFVPGRSACVNSRGAVCARWIFSAKKVSGGRFRRNLAEMICAQGFLKRLSKVLHG
jgi:hypothetical protein